MSDFSLWIWLASLAFGAASWAVARFLRSRRVRHWPVTMGRVESHRVHAQSEKGYLAEIGYSYSIMSEFYSGFYERRVAREKAADALFAACPKGTVVTIHYDPKNPERSEMEDPNRAVLGPELR